MFLLGGCSKSKEAGSLADMKLETMMQEVYKGIDENELPSLTTIPVTDENLSYMLGVSSLDYEEALASEPMMNAQAHSVVLVRMKKGADIEKAKKDIKEKVDPRKWICVGVEEKDVIVDSRDNVILLVMVNDYAKQIQKNFQNIK